MKIQNGDAEPFDVEEWYDQQEAINHEKNRRKVRRKAKRKRLGLHVSPNVNEVVPEASVETWSNDGSVQSDSDRSLQQPDLADSHVPNVEPEGQKPMDPSPTNGPALSPVLPFSLASGSEEGTISASRNGEASGKSLDGVIIPPPTPARRDSITDVPIADDSNSITQAAPHISPTEPSAKEAENMEIMEFESPERGGNNKSAKTATMKAATAKSGKLTWTI